MSFVVDFVFMYIDDNDYLWYINDRKIGLKGDVMPDGYWEASARYADGTEVCKNFPYMEEDSYASESQRQYELEEWLLNYHPDCIWFSVTYVAGEPD